MKKDTWQRVMYCDNCMKPTIHVIAYINCYVHKDMTLVKFASACVPCASTPKHKIKDETIPLEDWTALLTKEIYADV